MNFYQLYGKEIVALAVPIISWFLFVHFKAKAKLHVSNPHKFTYLVNQPRYDEKGSMVQETQTIHTSSYMVLNAGKEKATNLELVFNWKPLCINIWPSRKMVETTQEDGRHILLFDSLAPNEAVGCELVDINNEIPNLITARCNECVGKFVEMYPQPVVKQWQKALATVLMIAGFGLALYLLIVLVQFLVIKTPLGY